ncbi:MAG: Hsp20/alpha crystallin family protein [Dehalococcoidia bacterium]|jgi:HSP20 family protein
MLAIRHKNSPTLIDILDHFFSNPTCCDTDTDLPVKTPVHDIIENDKEYVVEMLLAGVKKDDITIDVEKDAIIIKAERKEVKDLKYNRKQSYFGKYERVIYLSDDADVENILASMEDGILKITVPKTKDVKTVKKSIEIK